MPSKMRRYGTAGRPGVPGSFSGPNNGAIRLHNSSGVCHIVANEVSVAITFLLHRDKQGKYMLPGPRFQFFGQTLRTAAKVTEKQTVSDLPVIARRIHCDGSTGQTDTFSTWTKHRPARPRR